MKLYPILFFYLCANTLILNAQSTMTLSLPEVIELAQKGAPDAQLAKSQLTVSYWTYQSALADFKPEIILNSRLPSINRSIRSITLPDGSQSFVESAFMENSIGVSLEQQIALTGGSIYATTGLERLDLFAIGNNPASTSYFATPIRIGFYQPLFGFNNLKWSKEIDPLRYDEAVSVYSEQMELLGYDAARLFFDVFIAQINLEADERDKMNADTLFGISKGRFSVGRIAETELLQIELSSMNADANLSQSTLNFQTATEALRNFLGIKQAVTFDLIAPSEIPELVIDPGKAVEYAKRYRSKTTEFQRRLKEAERNVAFAKSNNGRTIDIQGSFGLSRTAAKLGDAYTNPTDQEQLSIGLRIPIADWGKAKARTEIARSNLELEQMNIQQEQVNFEREVLLRVQQFDLVRRQVALSLRAYDASQKREDLTRKRDLIGKIGITELNLALREQNEARRAYMSALRAFWLAFYELRSLTLYDFEKNQALIREVD